MTLFFRVSLLIVFLFGVFCTTTHAASYAKDTRFALSLMNFSYKEFDDNDELLNREDGLLQGLTISMDNRVRNALMTGELSVYANDILYDGQTQSGIPVESRTDALILDFSLKIKHILDGANILPEQVYYGIGYRHWDRNIRDTKTDSGIPVRGIPEVYRLPYVLLGSHWDITNTQPIIWSLDLQLTRTVSAQMFVNLFEGTTLDLGERFGGRASLKAAYFSTHGKNFYIEPYFEYWQFGKSNSEFNSGLGYIIEPRSTTNNLGVNIGMQW